MSAIRIAIFGSTGSIGRQALEIIDRYRERFEVVLLTCFKNAKLLEEQAARFNPSFVSTPDPQSEQYLRDSKEISSKVINFRDAHNLIRSDRVDVVLNALVGASGLKVTIATILSKKKLLLANKESLVIGGEFLNDFLKDWRKFVVPVDSEHSAIFQCLTGEDPSKTYEVILTASGGPFVDLTKEELSRVSAEMALKHPTWKMGPKITIDSATLMNKGLEVIEAHYFFGVPYENIKVVVHRQSIVHGMVVFSDGTVKAVLSNPDMRLPIEYALFYPERMDRIVEPLDFSNTVLTFEEPDFQRFPCLRLAYEAGKKGGNLPIALNAANEVCVRAFLKGIIGFNDIPAIIEEVLGSTAHRKMQSLKEIIQTDAEARKETIELIRKRYLKKEEIQS